MAKKGTQETSADYDVGYGKPPRHSRFKPGQSGHPGRKKGSRNLKTWVLGVSGTEMDVTEGGRTRRATIGEGVVLRVFQKALSGDSRSIAMALDLMARFPEEVEVSEERFEEDAEILARAQRRMTRQREAERLTEC